MDLIQRVILFSKSKGKYNIKRSNKKRGLNGVHYDNDRRSRIINKSKYQKVD